MKRTIAALALATLVPAALSAQTQTATTASITDGVIYACYVPKTGTVYRINVAGSPTKCGTNHVSFSWNVSGPQGPAGTSGLSGAVLRTAEADVVAGDTKGATAKCEADEMVVSGGFFIVGGLTNKVAVLVNQPWHMAQETQPWGWQAALHNGDDFFHQLVVTALCVKTTN